MPKHISVKGVVQGVGLGPFVYGLATRLDLHGWVSNTPGGVEILVDGQSGCVKEFISSLTSKRHPLTNIESIEIDEVSGSPLPSFEIRESFGEYDAAARLSPDIAICSECARELFHPRNPRYLYPFISCRHCGPRFTILKDVPYDRSNTTMADFPICDRCREEYTDPRSRRFRAHSIACPECGPFVELRDTHSQFPASQPHISSIEIHVSAILKARRLLREGYIVAIKGPGGFHLACDASNPYTLAGLRERKGHSDKPFAVMGANIEAIASICEIRQEEDPLLSGAEKPIVLLLKKSQTGSLVYKVSELVAPNLDTLGVMLPYTALHQLLLNQTDPVLAREPVPPILVMTGGSFSEEPNATDNKDVLERLSSLADAFLLHNRKIHIPCDESVVQVNEGNVLYLRRSRGYVPCPVEIPYPVRHTLALGGESQNTFCLAREHFAFPSQHLGNMENAVARESFIEGIRHLSRLFGVQAEIIAHDLHPDHFMTHYGERSAVRRIGVQHHHAHIASCMADNGLKDRQVIGLCFDGPGYGTDGAHWGGEVLLASYSGFERFAHLEYLPFLDEDLAVRSPWRTAAGYAHALELPVDDLPFLQNVDKEALQVLRQRIAKGLDSPFTSSMGRLFDAVASLIGVRNEASYDGQSALEMEVLSKPFLSAAYPYPYSLEETDGTVVIRLREMFAAMIQDLRLGEPIGMIGARFHRTVAAIAIVVCKQARAVRGCNEVALSGEVWQNQTLLKLVCEGLRRENFTIYFHRQVPTNDGGLALGQAIIANFQFLDSEERRAQEEKFVGP